MSRPLMRRYPPADSFWTTQALLLPTRIFDNPSRSAKRKAMKKFISRLEQL
jgi:hypothetical protein